MSQEDELEGIVRTATEELLSRLGAAFSNQEGWSRQLRAVAYELRDFLVEDEERARAMILDAPHGTPQTRRLRGQAVEALAGLIDLGRGEHSDPAGVSRSAADITAGVVYNRIHAAVETGVETLDEELVRELMFSAVLPYRGLEAALAELEQPRPS